MKKIVGFFILTLFLVSCASVGLKERKCNQIPEGQESVLCNVFQGYVEEADLAIRLANVAALEKDIYAASTALNVIDTIKESVETGITYAAFANIVINKVSNRIGIVVAQEMERLTGIEIVISEFDRQLILDHLAKQRMLVLAGLETAVGNELKK